jgi:hypothetical protein
MKEPTLKFVLLTSFSFSLLVGGFSVMAASPPLVSLRSWGLPKVISPHFPSIPVRQVLFPADRFEVGLLHVVKHRISDAFIVQPG